MVFTVSAANAIRCATQVTGRLVGRSGDVLVGLVELCDGLGSRSCSAATWRLSVYRWTAWKSRAAGLLSSRSKVLAETGASSRARICLQRLGQRIGCDGVRSDDAVRVAVPTT